MRRSRSLHLGLLLLLASSSVVADEAAPPWRNAPWNRPRIHYTPSCYAGRGPHDIAAGVVTADNVQHLFPGCWATAAGLLHITSTDWVRWSEHQVLGNVRTSGGLAIDDDGTPVFMDVGDQTHDQTHWQARVRAANASGLMDFGEPEWMFSESSLQGGPGDPVRPWKRGSRWYAALALSACNDSKLYHSGSAAGWDCPLGALEDLWSSPALAGPKAAWRHEGPLLISNRSYLPWRPVDWEYVTPDYFAGMPGDPHPPGSADETYVFFTTFSSTVDGEGTCTAPGWGGPPCPNAPGGVFVGKNLSRPDVHIADLPMFFAGTQPRASGPIMPDWSTATLLDFGDMVPVGAGRGSRNASAVGRDALDVALQHGGTQFGCCAKTVAGPSNSGRRVIIGNLGNENPGKPASAEALVENTLSLPRDLSLKVSTRGAKEILQQYVPELASLRIASSHEHQRLRLLPPSSSSAKAAHWLGLQGKQLELIVRLSLVTGKALPPIIGLSVLCANASSSSSGGGGGGKEERTDIVVMRDKQLLAIDRQRSGDPLDSDVRAGPLSFWPALTDHMGTAPGAHHQGGATRAEPLMLHVYVDGSIVTVLAGNRTAVTAHVHPGELALGVGLFVGNPRINCSGNSQGLPTTNAVGAGAMAVDVEVEGWQLTPLYS
jgi:hypothetical protein